MKGSFQRAHHEDSQNVKIYSDEQTDRIKTIIEKISTFLTQRQKRDCTQFFNLTNVQYI